MGLVRERPTGGRLDVATVIREPLGVLLAAEQAQALQTADGAVRLDRLSDLQWLGFPREGSPAWYDELTAVLRSHGVQPGPATSYTQDLLPEVKSGRGERGRKVRAGAVGPI